MKLSRLSTFSLGLCLLGLVACNKDKDPNSNTGTQNTTAPGNGQGTGTGAPKTGGNDGETSGPPAPGSVMLGDSCKNDVDCESKICIVGFDLEGEEDAAEFKSCAACRDDAQCIAEKKGKVCTRNYQDGIIRCADGALGTVCDKDQQCGDGLMCRLVNLGDNKSWEKTCSECGNHTDCPAEGKRNCVSRETPDGPGLFNRCLEDKVRQSGEICFPCETGNRECAEGFCVKAEVDKGPGGEEFCLGVCGSCATDADCPADSRCTPPELDYTKDPKEAGIAIHKPSRCVKKG